MATYTKKDVGAFAQGTWGIGQQLADGKTTETQATGPNGNVKLLDTMHEKAINATQAHRAKLHGAGNK